MSIDSTDIGVVVEYLHPFTFKVRLPKEEVALCGLSRNYFGRVLPAEALKSIAIDGPRVGDEVRILLSGRRSGGMRQGVILRESS